MFNLGLILPHYWGKTPWEFYLIPHELEGFLLWLVGRGAVPDCELQRIVPLIRLGDSFPGLGWFPHTCAVIRLRWDPGRGEPSQISEVVSAQHPSLPYFAFWTLTTWAPGTLSPILNSGFPHLAPWPGATVGLTSLVSYLSGISVPCHRCPISWKPSFNMFCFCCLSRNYKPSLLLHLDWKSKAVGFFKLKIITNCALPSPLSLLAD